MGYSRQVAGHAAAPYSALQLNFAIQSGKHRLKLELRQRFTRDSLDCFCLNLSQ